MDITAPSLSSGSPVLAAKTSSGLHDFALSRLVRFLDVPSKILDVGAGTGAWAERLLALGHSVTCLDRNVCDFGLKSTSCIKADLNEDFSTAISGTYAAVTAIEVIEHLENPRHFLRQCIRLLDKGGIVVLTTPNIECVAGRLRFFLSGQFRMFGTNEALNDPTHITPIQTSMFEKIVRDTGYKIRLHDSKGGTTSISRPTVRLVCSVVTPFLSGFTGGDNHLFILSKD